MGKKKWIFFFGIFLLLLIAAAKFLPLRASLTSHLGKKNQSAGADTVPVTALKETDDTDETKDSPSVTPAFKDGKYTLSIQSSIGTLTYYNQTDVRWGDTIYGGDDLISTHGCGPTALAMLVTSFTDQTMRPDDAAKWAKDNNYWVSDSGSAHTLIPDGAEHFGFSVEAFTDYTEDSIIRELKDGSVFVALMGPGHFTKYGHFIILADDWSGSLVRVADPNSLENSQKPCELSVILDELNYSAQAGGPLWKISIK